MSIIITDLEMPTERESFNLTIKYNGIVLDTETGIQVAGAYELPPHGRCIDANAIWNLLYDYADSIGVSDIVRFDKIMEAAFSNALTVIEAEGGDVNGEV